MDKKYVKCLTPDCSNLTGETAIFCAACFDLAGSRMRYVWRIAFPYPYSYDYVSREPAYSLHREAISEMLHVIKIAKSQLLLFDKVTE